MNAPIRHRLAIITLMAGILSGLAAVYALAENEPDLERQRWPARWITHPTAPQRDYAVLFFRHAWQLKELPASFRIHVSADPRYRLLLNGREVSMGPARGDVMNWRYETAALAPWLQTGTNVLAAEVWNPGGFAPWAEHSQRTGFIVQGAEAASQVVNTVTQWQVLQSTAHCPYPEPFRLDS